MSIVVDITNKAGMLSVSQRVISFTSIAYLEVIQIFWFSGLLSLFVNRRNCERCADKIFCTHTIFYIWCVYICVNKTHPNKHMIYKVFLGDWPGTIVIFQLVKWTCATFCILKKEKREYEDAYSITFAMDAVYRRLCCDWFVERATGLKTSIHVYAFLKH